MKQGSGYFLCDDDDDDSASLYVYISIKRIRKFVKQTLCFLFYCYCVTHTHTGFSFIYIYIYIYKLALSPWLLSLTHSLSLYIYIILHTYTVILCQANSKYIEHIAQVSMNSNPRLRIVFKHSLEYKHTLIWASELGDCLRDLPICPMEKTKYPIFCLMDIICVVL